MKRASNLYDKITDIENIMNMYNNMSKGVKNKNNLLKFESYYTYNILLVQKILKEKKYNDIKYNIFLIREPKCRIVMSQNIKDKLINHLIAKYFLIDVLDKSLISTNVATRENKGTHYGIKKLKQYLVKMINTNQTVYALKFDIHKYFYKIDHQIILNLLNKKIKDQNVINIIKNILDSTNNKYINQQIKHLKETEKQRINSLNINIKEKRLKISEIDRIPYYEKDKGLPIGNMTSQILAIYYLNDLDHFIKEELKCKYYIRYMDDGLIISTDKEYLIKCLNEIKKIIKQLKLQLNDKTKIINISKNGVDFLGFKYYIKNKKIVMKVRKDTKKRFKNKVKLNDKQIISSYKGHFKHGNCHNLLVKYCKG